MKLSKKCEYALRALTRLNTAGALHVVSIQELARQERIPKKFLEQVLLALKKAGILQSSRGKAGGYSMGVAPEDVSLGDIIRAVDGPLQPLPCLNTTMPVKCADCVSLEHCWLRSVMAEVSAGLTTLLAQISLADICHRAALSEQQDGRALTYHI
ncbi:MAG: Rrf2 family transcriptional regulator [Candidatus Binatia bacterium]